MKKNIWLPTFITLLILHCGCALSSYLFGATDVMLYQLLYYWGITPVSTAVASYYLGKSGKFTPEFSATFFIIFLITGWLQCFVNWIPQISASFVCFLISALIGDWASRGKSKKT